MKYLLDTDTVIDIFEDRDNVRKQVLGLIEEDNEVALCVVTVAELYSGLSSKKRVEWDSWLLALPYWHIGFDVAVQAGTYRKAASEAGRPMSVSDSLLAALARDKGAILLTSNLKDYRMKDVRVMSLRDKAA
jgi:predicted nucleic acid-binding protein